jgi:hypothetical protein
VWMCGLQEEEKQCASNLDRSFLLQLCGFVT